MGDILKKCPKCKEEKPLGEFNKNKSRKDGLCFYCKICIREYQRKYNQENKEARIKYRRENKEAIRKSNKKYYQENKEARRKYLQKNKEAIREYRNKYKRKRRKTDSRYVLIERLRKATWRAAKGLTKPETTEKLLGCSYDYFMEHMEKQFYPHPDTGEMMSWENMCNWHIDHIRPLSSWSDEELWDSCHYSNLQPLWDIDNLSKGATWEEEA